MLKICDNCILRLYNKNYNLHGIGNSYNGKMIVVTNVDFNAYKYNRLDYSKQVEIIKDVLKPISSTGEVSEIYITPLIKCRISKDVYIDYQIIDNCKKHLYKEISDYGIKDILLLGDAAKIILGIKYIGSFRTKQFKFNGITYRVSYNPFIKDKDVNKYEMFKHDIIRWYYDNK